MIEAVTEPPRRPPRVPGAQRGRPRAGLRLRLRRRRAARRQQERRAARARGGHRPRRRPVPPTHGLPGAPLVRPRALPRAPLLASHDLLVRPDLHDEVGDFIRGLEQPVPDGFLGDTVVMYRTASPDWSGRWWTTLTWEHVRTWTLGGRDA
ncbi:hypothetical protein [Clavibacter tessellarius]|uniref:hypothetical protein n=1 Tax=Clavibacter tessellarius TaxID=31965 RepID=UPI00324EE3EA